MLANFLELINIALNELFDKVEVFKVGINFIIADVVFEMLCDEFDVVWYFFDVEFCVWLCLFWLKFDDISIVEVAYFLEASLKQISLHIFINFIKFFKFCENRLANKFDIKMVEMFGEHIFVKGAEGDDEDVLDQHDLGIADFVLVLFNVFILDYFALRFIVLT